MDIEELKDEIRAILEESSIDTGGRIIERTLGRLINYLGVSEYELLNYYDYYAILDCVVELVVNNHVFKTSQGIKSHSTGNTSITFMDIEKKASDFELYPIMRGWKV